jgi:hypothetical protein
MSDAIMLDPYGEHSPEYTLQVAGAISEAVRVLNYATGTYATESLAYPSTASSVVGLLRGGVGGLDQLFSQLGSFLTRLQEEGRLEVRTGEFAGHSDRAVIAVQAELDQAAAAADALYQALEGTQNAMTWISMPYGPG